MKSVLNKIEIIGLGVQKTASSWLEVQLNVHSDVFMSGEAFLFSLYGRSKGNKFIEQVFKRYKGEKYLGTYHNEYLYSDHSLDFLSKYYKNAKYFIILRDPIKRAISNFNHCKQYQQIPLHFSFEESLKIGGIAYQLIYRGYYDFYLEKLFEKIPSENVKILLYEDMLINANAYLTDLFEFLNINPEIDDEKLKNRENATYLPKSKYVYFLTKRLRNQQKYSFLAAPHMHQIYNHIWKINEKKIPPVEISETTIKCLVNQYSRTKTYIERLLDRDLSSLWLINTKQ